MTDHPGTFKGDTVPSGEQAWDDRAVIVPAAQDARLSGGGVPRIICGITTFSRASKSGRRW